MSATITSATWVANGAGASGAWSDATHWNTGSVPSATTNVLIGPSISATVPWTVTVNGNQAADALTLEMGSTGTLSVSGALSVTGDTSIGYGTMAGGVVDVGTGAALSLAGNMVASTSTFDVNGGTITTDGYADLDAVGLTIENNGVWNANSIWIGEFFTTGATVGAGGRLVASEIINLGHDGTQASPYSGVGTGSLIATGGGQVSAPSLDMVNGSQLTIDSQSAVVIGGGASVGGALAIGNAGTVALEAAKINADVVDDGTLTALVNPNAASSSAGTGPIITGALNGSGGVHVGSGYTLEIGNASNFAGSVTIDPSATLRLDAGTAPTGPISMNHGTLDLRGLAFGNGQTLNYAGGLLTVGNETLNVGPGLSVSDFSAQADSAGGTLITEVACYAAGTRIVAERNEVPVELLRPGDRVRTASGRIAPVRWVGQITIDLRRHPYAAPVCIAAGAFGPGLPRRDLLVSGDHALMIGEVLIPARKLVNGATIRREDGLRGITYVHVELDRHDLLLAEGLAAESYLDTGNRAQFEGKAPPPRFDEDPEEVSLRIFAERGCAPLVLRGPLVDAAHARLLARAEALGWRLVANPEITITADRPGLVVVPDGPDSVRAIVPPGTQRLRLTSRRFVPDHLNPSAGDGRTLGAALAVTREGRWLPANAFAAGWYSADAGAHWRWTDGAATITLPASARPSTLIFHLVEAGGRYWVRPAAAARAA